MCFDAIAAACQPLRLSVATERSSSPFYYLAAFFLAFAAICWPLRQRLAQVQLNPPVLTTRGSQRRVTLG
jgi:hypothetical protein